MRRVSPFISLVAVTAALLLAAPCAAAGGASPLAVLLGWTGDGKTYTCNRHDGTKCGKEGSGGRSETTEPYVGQHFIDPAGFGDNRVGMSEQWAGLQVSLGAMHGTLKAIDGKTLRAVVWVVNCLNFAVTNEALELVKLFVSLLGHQPPPLVALFNSRRGDCVMQAPDFVSVAAEHGVNVSRVYGSGAFDTAAFEAAFPDGYTVLLPPNLDDVLADHDKGMLLQRVSSYRRLQCEQVAGKKANATASIEREEQKRVAVSDLPKCSGPRACPLSTPTRTCPKIDGSCTAKSVRRFGFFGPRDCVAWSAPTDDVACLRTLNAEVSAARAERDRCVESANADVERCSANYAVLVKDATARNAAVDASVGRHVEALRALQEVERACGDLVRPSPRGVPALSSTARARNKEL